MSQSPKFSFTQHVVSVTSDTVATSSKIKVYKGSYSKSEELQSKKAILGNSFTSPSVVKFSPLVPFQVNTTYTAIYNNILYKFFIPVQKDYKRLTVDKIYPNSPTLPVNFLKWYVSFSKPVNPTNIYNHISLINTKTNKKVDRAVLPLENPLLSKDGKLLTLWIEPGRQKRNLGPNKRLGEVLIEGESYSLLIDEKLKDRNGVPMNSDFEYTFTVTEADRLQPNINQWIFELPKSNTKEPLIINFNDNLDYGSLYNSLSVTTKNNIIIDGVFSIDTNNKKALFIPLNNWKKEDYTLKCNSLIEDVAGNNLEHLFDRDVTKKLKKPILRRSFSIKK